MVQLLRESQIAASFQKAMKNALHSVVAVPFWGDGAVTALGLLEGSPIRIVCNLDHPGCNPHVIDALHALRIKIRTHPRLHAKIYATPEVAIVGSSNVSTNGMLVEGSTSKGSIEANVSCDDPQFVTKVLDLFEEIWDARETRPVRSADIEDAKERWLARPKIYLFRGKTLLAACREDKSAFQSVYVAAYNDNVGENGFRMLSEVKDSSRPTKGLTVSDFHNASGFQFKYIPKGAWLIDLDCRQSDKVKFRGSAQATEPRLRLEGEPELTIAIPGPITIGGRKLVIKKEERASIVAAAGEIIARSQGRLVPLSEVVKIIDRAR